MGKRCFLCGRMKKLQVHHINWHHFDDRAENRIRLCQVCHAALHNYGYMSREEIVALRAKGRSQFPLLDST